MFPQRACIRTHLACVDLSCFLKTGGAPARPPRVVSPPRAPLASPLPPHGPQPHPTPPAAPAPPPALFPRANMWPICLKPRLIEIVWSFLDRACHPCAGAMLIFSVSFQFLYMSFRTSTPLYGAADGDLCDQTSNDVTPTSLCRFSPGWRAQTATAAAICRVLGAYAPHRRVLQ